MRKANTLKRTEQSDLTQMISQAIEDEGLFNLSDEEDIKLSPEDELDGMDADVMASATAELDRNDPLSFFDLEETKQPRDPDKLYKITEIKVTSHLIKRKRVEMTPSMCDVPGCQFDSAKANGFPTGYYAVPPSKRQIFATLVDRHKKKYHNRSEEFIIAGKDMPRMWLSKH